MTIVRAISIRQPYVEQILRGTKREEFRSTGTNIRERVWIYASARPAEDPQAWRAIGRRPDELPAGVIVGSVEIVSVRKGGPSGFAYKLSAPKRLKRPKHAKNQPQPVFWRPKF